MRSLRQFLDGWLCVCMYVELCIIGLAKMLSVVSVYMLRWLLESYMLIIHPQSDKGID